MAKAFLHCHHRFKNGNDHCYWSIAEKVKVAGGKWVQRHILYPADRRVPDHAAEYGVNVRLSEFRLHRPRQWGACWVGCLLWQQLGLDEFWAERLMPSREGTNWRHILKTLTIYRLIDPGSEWRLHRQWFGSSAMADLLEEDFGLVEKDNLYRCLDKLLEHRTALFKHLR